MLHGVEPLAVQPDEDLEIVDFSDMGKFVGVADPPPTEEERGDDDRSSRPSRPVAADFFGENSSSVTSKSDTGPWRRKLSHDLDHDSLTSASAPPDQSDIVSPLEQPADTTSVRPHVLPEASLDSSTKEKPVFHDPQSVAGPSRIAPTLPVINGQRGSRPTPAFREAAMSTIDDTMSRIKGALDNMQQTAEMSKDIGHSVSGEVQPAGLRSKVPPTPTAPRALPRDKWVPPALRPRHYGFDQQPQEVFDITIPEPPRSPRPAWNAFVVRLPRFSRILEPLTKRQFHLNKSPPGQVRWDILSFVPPVKGMTRRDFSLNDVLFPKTQHTRRYVVSLHKPNSLPREVSGPNGTTGPKVRVSAPKVNGAGAFGRPSGAIDLSTWRKSTAPTPTKPGTVVADSWLNTVSRSPPPELASNLGNTPPIQADESATTRPRSQPKMPAGSAVAFYRDTRVDSLESAPKSSVNFTVTSELEDAAQSKLKAGSSKSLPASSPSAKVAITLPSAGAHVISVVSELKSQPASPELVHAVGRKSCSRSSEDTVSSLLILNSVE
jgi:serine/arginine repetitive matrix protein 2